MNLLLIDCTTFRDYSNIKSKAMKNGTGVIEKMVVSILCIWSFIHTYLLLKTFRIGTVEFYDAGSLIYRKHVSQMEEFYPFTFVEDTTSNANFPNHNFDLRFYDYTEYFVYVGGVWMIYFLYRYLKRVNKVI